MSRLLFMLPLAACSIGDGLAPELILSPESFDEGDVLMDGVAVREVLTIENGGPSSLEGTVTVDTSATELTGGGAFAISGGGSGTVTLTFLPALFGEF